MKYWFPHIIMTSAFIVLLASFTLAQEAGMSDVEIIDERDISENENLIYIPGEDVRYIPGASGKTTARDSISLQIYDFPMQQATMKAPEKAAEKQTGKTKDDSILTFNFLYFIIQKYKLQDIID